MLYRALVYAVAGVMLAITQAAAATYTYTGIASPGDNGSDYYVSATVDLSCAGPCTSGTYTEGGTLISFSLSIDGPSPSNASVYSLSNTTPGYVGGDNPNGIGVNSYVTLSNMGGVISITNWSVFADVANDPGLNFAIYTLGNDPTNGTQDYYADNGANGGIASGELNANPGVWAGPGISATPLPSTWTMLIAGFAGLGFFAFRGSKKNAAVLTA